MSPGPPEGRHPSRVAPCGPPANNRDAVDVAVEGVLDTVARIRNGEYVDSGGPVTEDPPNLFASTESRFRPAQADR